ncbi:MAG: hypothetical protein ORN58_01700 [Sediminibacterium sp.]|nr:hypothetical protein [Sediminibacterium sp.]
MKKIVLLLTLLVGLNLSNAQSPKKGLITEFIIEGTESTDMSAYYNGKMVENFRENVKSQMVNKLKGIFNLDSIEFVPNFKLELKRGLNTFTGVKKIDKVYADIAQNFEYTFKIKCEIAFNETVGGFIIDETSARAKISLFVGVFNKNLERQYLYKGKAKDGVVFFGKNAHRVKWLAREDFEAAYQSALEELKKD